MSWRRALVWILLFALLAIAGVRGLERGKRSSGAPGAGATVDATIERVVDGDTVVAALKGESGQRRLRYIGVDTPETVKPGEPVQCFGKAASTFNRGLVEGRHVHLQIGRERFDRYGRLLAYVYLNDARGTSVNATLVARGYARTLAIPPNTKFAARFAALQSRARALNLGLWRACPGI
jgi:micrococcal nuclease